MTSAIVNVSCYVASSVEACDRCSAAIKYVTAVTYRDGLVQRYGSECINKILDGDTSLKSLYQKSAKKLKKYQSYLAALSLSYDQMPRGSEYYGSGLYFIADANGDDVCFDHWFFHPLYDEEKNTSGYRYVVTDPVARLAECQKSIENGKIALTKEIARIEGFLARVLSKASTAKEVA